MTTSRAPARRTSSTKSDVELIGVVATGSLDALGALYDRHATDLHGFARRAAPTDDPEDVVQQVFLRVIRIAPTFDAARGTVRAWLFGVTAHVIRERRRSLRRLARALLDFGTDKLGAVAAPPTDRVDVTRALAKLGENRRIVFLLAEIEGFTGPEIAEMIGVPVGTVWTRLHHARRDLRTLAAQESR